MDGDLPSSKKGGISEADAIVKEARKNLDDSGTGAADVGDKGLREEIIREEEEKEPGPELKTSRVK